MPTRRAHTVHLTAPTEALVRRGTLLLEDALHTASLPDGSRLLLVRQLQVGQIHPRCSPATLALKIEHQFQRITPIAATAPATATATAVYFEDAIEPYCLLCEHIAQGQQPTAWFWRVAVPQWQPHQSPAETYRQVLLHLAEHPQALLAIAHLIGYLSQRHALTPLLAALTPQEATPFLTRCRLPQSTFPLTHRSQPSSPPAPDPPATQSSPHPLTLPLSSLLKTWIPLWGIDDARSHWLTLISLIHANPARVLSPELPTHAQTLIQQTIAAASDRSPALSPDAVDSARGREPIADSSNPLPSPSSSPPASLTPLPLHTPIASSPRPRSDWHPTPHSGFFFTLNLLNHLHFPQVLTTHPVLIETAFPNRLLLALAQHLAIPAEDPIHPTQLFADCQRPMSDCRLPTPLPWLRWMHRWCQRHLEMSLADLVKRPGELRTTPTHWDLRFNLDQSDIRIRRIGLDFDPGWVPWLGRVITFHYSGGSTYAV
ncbi:MAG: hypothetical protein F6J95_026135 [Leptolyngbya sp. SIO1E4]|nr:hypothetical protein [Leptolyngbya sp. SIO1E4]